jgi:hypothetical protein
MHPKIHSLPFPATSKRDKQRRKKRDGSSFSFSLEKESNHRNVWIYVLEDAKDSQQQHDF